MSDTSTPNRYRPGPGTTESPSLTVGGWSYEDEEQTRFAFLCSTMGLGMPSFDDYIDSLPDGIGKQELLDWRQQAFKAFKDGNNHALKGWLQAAHANWRARLTVDHVRPTLALGMKYSESQSEKGKKSAEQRWALSGEGLKMADIVESIALSREHEDETAKELWPYLYAALDESRLHPKEQANTDDWKKSIITYDMQNGRKQITGGQFANVVSENRKRKKSG